MPRRLVTTLLAVLVSVGCASSTPLGPDRGSSGWHELLTEHVRLQTDLSITQARAAAAVLEQLQQAIVTAVWGGIQPSTEPTAVILFLDADEYGRYAAGPRSRHWRLGPEAELVSHGPPERWGLAPSRDVEVAPKEIVAGMVAALDQRAHPTAPPWFRFGLVSYFSTLELDPASGAVGWGKLHRDLWEAYRSYLSLSLALLNHWNAGFGEMEPARRGEYEALSWAAVCWMANARPKSLHAFQLAFARGASPQDAWKEALGDRSIPELDAEMRTTMDRGRFAIGEARVPASVAVQNERALTDEEIARLFFQAGNALGARSPPR